MSGYTDVERAGKDDVATSLQRLANLNHQLDRDVAAIGTRRDSPDFRSRLATLVEEGLVVSKSIASQLKFQKGRSADKLRSHFSREVKRFQKLSNDVKDKEARVLARMSLEVDHDDTHRKKASMGGQTQTQVQGQVNLEIMEPELVMLEEREEGLRVIAKDVLQVNEMMKDLAFLVEEQQTDIDFIHDNVSSAHAYVDRGETELITASAHQRSSRSRMCYLLLILLAGLTGLVLYLSLH